MKTRKILSVLLTLAMLTSFMPTFTKMAWAETSSVPETTCNINLSETLSTNDNYYVYDNRIVLSNRAVVYVLSGTTDKKIAFAGSPENYESQTYYVRFNNASIGDIVEDGSIKLSVNIDVPENTVNKMKCMRLSNAEITGKGTLNAEDTIVNEGEKLSIKDTTVNISAVNKTTRPCWDGKIEIGGSACVTFKGNGVYSPLTLGNDIQNTPAELTLKDNAKLYVLQDDMDEVSTAGLVDGLATFNNTKIVLQDNSYLEAEGKAGKTADEYRASGIIAYGSLTVKDNATLKATAYGQAIVTMNEPLVIQGGTIIAESKESDAIDAWDADLNISNATIEVTSEYFGIFSDYDINITNSKVTAKSQKEATVYGRKKLKIENAYIDAKTSSTDTMAIGASNDISVQNSLLKANGGRGLVTNNGKLDISGSWIETQEAGSSANTITNSVIFRGNEGQVYGDHTIPFDAKVTEEMELTIPENTTLTVPDKKTFTNNGDITLKGSFVKNEGGTVICTSHTGGTATCIKAKCGICGADYGNTDNSKHINLKHFEAKKATTSKEGNIEYWYCEDCEKYFSDKNCSTEITLKDTIISKVKNSSSSSGSPTNNKKPTSSEWQNPFIDVVATDWYYNAVKYVNQNDLMGGMTSTIFAPNTTLTRGMLITILYRIEGSPAVTGTTQFADVDTKAYYAKAVLWGEQNDIIKGYSPTKFVPDQNITREQLAVILQRYAQYKGYDTTQGGMQIREYSDYEQISGYALNAMTWAVNSEILKGKGENQIAPKDLTTRAETAAILQRFIEENQ